MSTIKILKWACNILLIPATLFLLFHGLLALGTVPAPNARNSETVTGVLAEASIPHPKSGDMAIVLTTGRRFYVNRANESDSFEWQAFLNEVEPGDEVTLTAVSTVAKRLFNFTGNVSPVAGVKTAEKVYMDPDVASRTWFSQALFSTIALYGLGAWLSILVAGFCIRNPKIQKRMGLIPSA